MLNAIDEAAVTVGGVRRTEVYRRNLAILRVANTNVGWKDGGVSEPSDRADRTVPILGFQAAEPVPISFV